jgi:hypothetical protein
MKDEAFQRAIDELTLWARDDSIPCTGMNDLFPGS